MRTISLTFCILVHRYQANATRLSVRQYNISRICEDLVYAYHIDCILWAGTCIPNPSSVKHLVLMNQMILFVGAEMNISYLWCYNLYVHTKYEVIWLCECVCGDKARSPWEIESQNRLAGSTNKFSAMRRQFSGFPKISMIYRIFIDVISLILKKSMW